MKYYLSTHQSFYKIMKTFIIRQINNNEKVEFLFHNLFFSSQIVYLILFSNQLAYYNYYL